MNALGPGKLGRGASERGFAAALGVQIARLMAAKLVVSRVLLGVKTDGCLALDSSGSFLEVKRNGTPSYGGLRAGRSFGTLESIPRCCKIFGASFALMVAMGRRRPLQRSQRKASIW